MSNPGSIPLPPPSSASSTNEAWQRAQAALSSVQQKPTASTQNYPDPVMLAQQQFYRQQQTGYNYGMPAPNYNGYGQHQPSRQPGFSYANDSQTYQHVQQFKNQWNNQNNIQWNQQHVNVQQQQPKASWDKPGSKFALPQPQQQGNKFQPFKMGGTGPVSLMSSSFAPPPQKPIPTPSTNMPGLGPMPDNVRKYVERSFAAARQEDLDKLQDYLKKRLQPLLQSGAVRAVNWDKEPLPSEKNYQINQMWTPASQIGIGMGQKGPSPMKKNNGNGRSMEWNTSAAKRQRNDSGSVRSRSRSRSSSPEVVAVKTKKTKLEKKQHKADVKAAKKAAKETKKQQQLQKKPKWQVAEDSRAKEDRARRFAGDVHLAVPTAPVVRMKKVVGTCQNVEKSYFRLTAAPDPATVRPRAVLEKALAHIQNKCKQGEQYRWLSSQLKACRQDCTVQQIRDDLAVRVYETSARIALENKDREDYNQCQNQLKVLYQENPDSPNESEFVAYRMLYYIWVENVQDVSDLLGMLDEAHRRDPTVQFTLRVRAALAARNYVKFFKLYEAAPRMCPYIMDQFVERERKAAMNVFVKAFRPTIPVALLADFLGMKNKELVEWLGTLDPKVECATGGVVDCRIYANAQF